MAGAWWKWAPVISFDFQNYIWINIYTYTYIFYTFEIIFDQPKLYLINPKWQVPGGSGHGVHCSLLHHQGEAFSQEIEANKKSVKNLLYWFEHSDLDIHPHQSVNIRIFSHHNQMKAAKMWKTFTIGCLLYIHLRWQQWTLQEAGWWPVTTLSARLVISKKCISSTEDFISLSTKTGFLPKVFDFLIIKKCISLKKDSISLSAKGEFL